MLFWNRFSSVFSTKAALALVLAVSLPFTAAAAVSKAKQAKKKATAVSVAKASKAGKPSKVVKAIRSRKVVTTVRSRPSVVARVRTPVRVEVERPSYGQAFGLHGTLDPLALKSSVALVLDQDTNEVLFSKNSHAVLPIASLTKLMTAVVVTEAQLPLDEILTVTQDDVDTEKGSSSRLSVGAQLTREEMLHLALMSSENRAAHALGRHYPGGLTAFVRAMNAKALQLGMSDTRYVEPTGLSSNNQSSARDLATLVNAAYDHRIIRELSTSHEYQVAIGARHLQYRNTNGLVRSPDWDIGLQKTGYIAEAGRCLVMQTRMAGRKLIMVFLDSAGRYSRIGDAERVRRWVSELPAVVPSMPTLPSLPATVHGDQPKLTS